ncbi:hypothetical protein BMYO_0635 [Bifidobacterium myosotis]|uniref:Uncharacterized protein n=1 Tax=Bifidobacterium myosotis TaxID=1630166 RepID=A0A261FP22_9BIFI|nr:hypothetical protein BMYO_0635 [Bifidobacterium myosotis]
MRGEHIMSQVHGSGCVGSSPHARGTRRRVLERAAQTGIIPACAGNTRWTCRLIIEKWDHPRMRGEHVNVLGGMWSSMGSSPHARGTPVDGGGVEFAGGIIPACAGNTARRQGIVRVSGDHPRMRGEHAAEGITNAFNGGSSPHARGTHLQSVAISRDIWMRRHLFPSLSFSALFAESPTSATPLQRIHQRISITKCKDSGQYARYRTICKPLLSYNTSQVLYDSPLRQSSPTDFAIGPNWVRRK